MDTGYRYKRLIGAGKGGLVWLIRLLYPGMLRGFSSPLKGISYFQYSLNGFIYNSEYGVKSYAWTDIDTVFGYKEDYFTTDEICMEIFFTNDRILKITESLAGWYEFNEKLAEATPGVPANWYGKIAQPPFATNITLLYDKRGRSFEVATKAAYGG